MTKEEILEMIDATITTNGMKEITGASLNAALTAIVEAMGTGSGGGASAEEIYSDFSDGSSLTDDMKAKNAAVYAKAKAAYEGGTALPLCMVDVSLISQGDGGEKITVLASMIGFGAMNEGDPVVLALQMAFMGISLAFEVSENGNCITQIQAS